MRRRWTSHDEADTRALGAQLAAELAPAGVLLLEGEIGSGKTVLTQGLAAALGLDPKEVQSPTFTLVREHGAGAGRLVHVDLYRLQPAEVFGLGLDELLAGPGIKVIEWAERLPYGVPAARRLRLERLAEGGRRIEELEP